MQHGELRSEHGSWFVIEFFQHSFFNINDTFKTGDWSSYIFLKLVYFTYHNCAREGLCGIDACPVSVSSEHVERKERGDPFTKPTKIPKPITKTARQNGETHFVPKSRNGCKNSEKISWMIEFLTAETHSHEPSLELASKRREDLGVALCLHSLP